MIDSKRLTTIATEAQALAQYFYSSIRNYLPEELLQDRDLPDIAQLDDPTKFSQRAMVSAISDFVEDVSGALVTNVVSLHCPEFASWLVGEPNGFSIALSERQIVAWLQQNGMPNDLQQIRTTLHELGHIYLGHVSNANHRGYVASVNPAHEEEAWFFSFAFSGILLGNYAVSCRSKRNCDRSPAVRV